MIHKLAVSITICSLAIFFNACNTHKKLLEKGNYFDAVIKSVDKLRSNPSNGKAKQTLKEAYPLAEGDLLRSIDQARAADPQFQWSTSVYAYEDLNRLYEKVQDSPAARKIIPNAKSYYTELGSVKKKAAEEQYQAGITELNLGTRLNAKEAYQFFERANAFEYNYKDVAAKLDESLDRALLKIIVNKIPVPSKTYQVSAGFFYDQVNDVLNRIEQNEFVRFYTPSETRKIPNFKAHQIIQMNFEDFSVGNTHTSERVEKIQSADSVKVGQVTLEDGKKKDVFNLVYAELSTYRIEVISGGILKVVIKDTNRTIPLLDDQIPGKFTWYHEWATFKGDERALSKEQISLSNRRMAQPPPHQQLFVEFTKPIYSQLSGKLRQYYRGI